MIGQCPAGWETREGTCVACPPGMYRRDSAPLCQLCGKGTYADSFGSAACINCPQGQHTLSLGMRRPQACKKHSGNRYSGELQLKPSYFLSRYCHQFGARRITTEQTLYLVTLNPCLWPHHLLRDTDHPQQPQRQGQHQDSTLSWPRPQRPQGQEEEDTMEA